jgi:hypothetical protein
MSTIVWPSSVVPAAADFGIEFDVQLNVMRSGRVDTYGLPGARWVATITPKNDNDAGRAAVEAIIVSLRGGARRLQMGHFGRPVPHGTLRGSPVLASPTTVGANTIVLANAMGANLLTYPQEFDNATWSKDTRVTVIADSATAPDGTLTADKLIETATNALHYIGRNLTVVAGSVATFSVYAKAAERYLLDLRFGGAGQSPQDTAIFNLSTGTGSTTTGISANIESVGDGWYRCSLTGTWEAATAAPLINLRSSAAGNGEYTGDGTSGLYLWGAQLEAGTLTDYDPYATLKAGDLIGLGTQLLMAEETATADAAGEMTVKVSPAVRAVYSAGTAVVWDHPTILWIPRSSTAGPFPYLPGYCPQFSIELVEAG